MEIGPEVPLDFLVRALATRAPQDQRIIDLWLDGKAPRTQRIYQQDVEQFLRYTGVPVVLTTYANLIDYSRVLRTKEYAPRTLSRHLYTIKSILTFCHRQGWTLFNVGHSLRLPHVYDDLEERILSQEEILNMIAAEPVLRNCLFMVLLYYGGIRVGELCWLRWCHIKFLPEGGCTLKILGKGSRIRYVALEDYEARLLALWREKSGAVDANTPIVNVTDRQVRRIIMLAAKRVGIKRRVYPHSFRHAHASHSQDNGEQMHVVQKTLGHSDIRMTGHYTHIKTGIGSGRSLQRPANLAAAPDFVVDPEFSDPAENGEEHNP